MKYWLLKSEPSNWSWEDQKKSKVDIVQAAGRALRLSEGKKYGYIFTEDEVDLMNHQNAQRSADTLV